MGFFDTLGDFGQKAFNAASGKAREVEAMKNEFRDYDDDRLKWTFKNSSGFRKMAAGSVLKERGYRIGN